MEEFNRNKYIFSSSPAIIEVGEEVRRIREKQISFMLKELFLYKILVKDLVNIFPTYRDRNLILNIASYIYEDYELFEKVQKKRELPVAMVAKRTRVSRTFLEIWQDYILVYVIILSNPNYKYIQDYIRIEERSKTTALVPKENKNNDIKKGIVLKVNKRSVIVFTSAGKFLKLKKEGDLKVGQEYRGKEKKGIRNYKLQICIGAVFLTFILAGGIYQYTKSVRTVVIDTTSQLKYELNRFNKVIYTYSPTQKGKDLINAVNPKYKNIDKALEESIRYAKENDMIPNQSILITISGEALKYGLLEDTARYVKEEKVRVLVNNSGKEHNIKEMVNDEKESKDEQK